MSDSAELGSADLRELLDLVDAARADEPGPAIPWSVLDGLRNLINCASISFNMFDVVNRQQEAVQSCEGDSHRVEVGVTATDTLWWNEFPRFSREAFGQTSPGAVCRVSARLSLEQFRRSPLWAAYWQPSIDCMFLKMPAAPGHFRKLVLWQDDEPFTARDEAVLKLLQAHLIEIDREACRRRTGTPQLTPREWEVLELTAEGRSNKEIARALVTSVSTVRKHLEHIYDRTGARSRSAAVARMMSLRG